MPNYAKLGYGTKSIFWESVANALKTRTSEFSSSSFPSAESCCTQFEKLLKERQEAKKNHKFLSGTTEELDEIASGLEDIMQEMEAVADDIAAKEQLTDAQNQENHLKRGRSTPKSALKNAETCSSLSVNMSTVFTTNNCFKQPITF